MSDYENYPSIDPPMTRSKTPLPMNFWQNVNDPPVVNSRKAPFINRPAPASMKRKMEQAAHVKDLMKQCKPVSINLERLSQQVITKMTKKREHRQHNHVRRSKKQDRNRWQRGYVDKRKKPKIEKSTEGNKNQTSQDMRPTHIWGCCRMIPFDRNRLRNQKRFAITNNKEELIQDISKIDTSIESPSTSKLTKSFETEKQTNQKNIGSDDDDDQTILNNEEESCVCRRIIPYNRKTSFKAALNSQNDNSTQAGGSKNNFKKKGPKIGPKISKTENYHSKNKTESSPLKKTETNLNDTKKSDDSMEEDSSWFNNRSIWKVKRKNRSRRISSSDDSTSNDEKTTSKKRRISSSDDSITHEMPQKKKFTHQEKFTNRATNSHQSSILTFLYRKPKPLMKEVRIILSRLENMMNDPDVIRWRNREIKIEKIEDEQEEQEENFQNEKYYLLHEDGTMSSEPIPQEALYQFGNYPQEFIRINTFNGEMLDVANYINTLQQSEVYNPVNSANQEQQQQENSIENVENNPKVLLIRLETLVGALDSEYSASEIEILEEKYIDFLLNSNFSYDKQSQSFFNVYKRLQAKRLQEKQREILNEFTEQINTMDDNDIDEDDKIALSMNEIDNNEVTGDVVDHDSNEIADEDENPLVIALENDKIDTIVEDWASDDSNSAPDNNEQIQQPSRYSIDAPSRDSIEFVTCDSHPETTEATKESYYISCKFCKNSFRTLHSFSLHKGNCHAKHKKPIKCDHCGTQYKCRRNLNVHIQLIHGINDEKSKTKTIDKKVKSTSSVKSNTSGKIINKKRLPQARNNLRCGVCSITLETKESLFDHIYQHTERELQEAFHDATIRKRDEELRKEEKIAAENEWANKYAQWKDSILCKNNGSDESTSTSGQNVQINSSEEITVCSSNSEELRKISKENEASQSRTSVIKSTKTTTAETTVVKKITMCPCHSNDTSTLVNDDMQIEMVLLCEICQVLFRRLECFEVHYRVNRLCNRDRSSRLPKLFCSSCKILLNSLPEMRRHLEKHALVNRQGHVTFLCNICKVMFFGIGSLFYSHWFNHNKDVNFLASRYSFPKLSIVPCMNLTDKVGNQNNKEEYLFIAEHVCRNCKIPFGSEIDLEHHNCTSGVPNVPVVTTTVRVMCLVCNKMFPNKMEYFMHELNINHMRSTKPEYVTISTNAGQKAYICAQCKTVRKSTDEMKEHWTFHRAWREKYICSYCPKFFDSNINVVEAHCKNCTKDLNPYCKVSFELATFKCQPCNLYFETSQEAKEHNIICLRSQFAITSESSNKQITSSISSSLSANAQQANSSSSAKTSPPIFRLTVPSSALSSVASKAKTVNNSESPSPSINDAKLTDAPSGSKVTNSLRSFRTQKITEAPLEKDASSSAESRNKNGLVSNVEVIDIISESSSKSTSSDIFKQPSDSVSVPKNMPSLMVDQNKQIEQSLKSVPTADAASPEKKKKKKKKKTMMTNSDQSEEKNISKEQALLKAKKNLTVTAINPEFESLLTELEGMEMTPGKDSKRPKKMSKKIAKEKSKGKQLTLKEILKDPLETNEELPPSDTGSASSKSGKTSTLSENKSTNSPLPFEVVLVPEEENPKSSGNSSSQVDINSNKSDNSTTKAAECEEPKDSTDPNSASIIEEYIEYIMMDVMSDSSTSQSKEPTTTVAVAAAEVAVAKALAEVVVAEPPPSPKEISPPVEKVAPTRLRVRSLAELQEIKMPHLCETCGKSFNVEKEFIEHTKKGNCSHLKAAAQSKQMTSNYETTTFIPTTTGKSPMNFIPPLLPIAKNISIPRSTVPPILNQRRLTFTPHSEINHVNSAFSSNVHHRSSATPIQLPERIGGNTPQKRPSGAATRIQNLSHPPRHQTMTPSSMIQHQGLPHTYMNRAPVRINQSRPTPSAYNPSISSAQQQYRATTDASTSLTCTTCFFTAKNLAEFSAHLLVHYMDNSANDTATNIQGVSNQTDPNTSAFQNPQIIASDIYGTSSVTANNATTRRNWPSASKYLYVCRLCSFQTDSKPVIREHEKHHIEVENNLQQLQKQQIMHNTYQTQQQQQQVVQQQQQIPQTVTLVQTINQPAPPPTINSKTKDSDKGPILLYSSVSNDVFQCLLCNSFFFSVHEDFVKHLQTVHKQSHKENIQQNPTENVCYVCDYCDPPQVFNNEINLRKHMEYLHNHNCHICGQRCTSREILQNHVISHKIESQAQ